ncbi:hypothetical protein SLS59_002050 [Nothophoma quercina]|uniref:Uncharacterized protein n=1 Tax=Nothophoma quercina TaxID=749835 RepID=A0ABR3RWQ5_9PLEO
MSRWHVEARDGFKGIVTQTLGTSAHKHSRSAPLQPSKTTFTITQPLLTSPMLEYDLIAYRRMSNLDSHPRVLSLSAGSSANTSIVSTPVTQSLRVSHDSQHDAHHFINLNKTEKTLNSSIKKLWKDLKHAAAEHHRSVNAAYEATHGAGARLGAIGGVRV